MTVYYYSTGHDGTLFLAPVPELLPADPLDSPTEWWRVGRGRHRRPRTPWLDRLRSWWRRPRMIGAGENETPAPVWVEELHHMPEIFEADRSMELFLADPLGSWLGPPALDEDVPEFDAALAVWLARGRELVSA